MAKTPISLLLLRRLTLTSLNPKPPPLSLPHFNNLNLKPYSTTTTAKPLTEQPKPSSLPGRMSFVFDQIDATERERAEKLQTLQKIRAWRQSKDIPREELQETVAAQNPEFDGAQKTEMIDSQNEKPESGHSCLIELKRKTVELVHPWPEWIELMESRKVADNMVESTGLDVSGVGNESDGDGDGVGIDFNNFRAVQTACINFGKDRFDIFRFLSKQDIQILVGYGCPNVNKKVVFSSKLLRKHVHLDEGDVCSNCRLRSSCESGYLLTNKEDEARTIDLMRVLLAYGFDSINGSVANTFLLKQKLVRTVVRKLLHEVAKLSAVPIDPNLPPPVIKGPPPKVKKPPPPRKRVGRDGIDMKKGDWLCPICDFMNFAKNVACLQCDAKRPKRQLIPGEWECPECNFLNYRRNMACLRCDCKRPPDALMENVMEERQHVSNACNFDFDDNVSDGADVAAFEYADSAAIVEDSPLGVRKISREYSVTENDGFGRGFDDFDDEDDIERDGDSDCNLGIQLRTAPSFKLSKPKHPREAFSGSDDELNIDSDEERSVHPKWKSSHIADTRNKIRGGGPTGPSKGLSFGSDNEIELDSDGGDGFGSSHRIQGRKGSDDSFSGSESDNSHRRSSRNRTGGNKLESGRRGNHFRCRDHDFVRDNETRFEGKMGDRRKSWGDDSGRSSPGKNRGFQGTDRSDFHSNNNCST
ncbi:DNA polymerase zeta catalytic [Salix suchowensis]|nr:DNA polymerase zeta catalytic [Salix suchowensis]